MKPYKKFKRVFGVVMDSIGIGETPDADKFDDVGSDTLGHIGELYPGDFSLPTFSKLGLSNIRPESPIAHVPVAEPAIGYFGKMREISVGKDSMDGHWEMMGLPVTEPLGYFPNGFDDELVGKIESFSGRRCVLNAPYSGTDAIRDSGEQQLDDGVLSLYTSAD